MRGRIYRANDLKLWSITIYDHTTGQYSSLSTNCIQPQGDRVACVLEAWNIEDNANVPGDTLFYDRSTRVMGRP